MTDLKNLIKNKRAKIGVIGLGYIGLPAAVELAKTGFRVFGIDIRKERVKQTNQGKSYIDDVNSQDLKRVINSNLFKAFSNHCHLENCDIVLICVPTPLDKNKVTDISYIKNTVQEISKYLHKNQLIILESSTYPGTTREIILSQLQKTELKVGKDFFLSYSPERIDPGNKKYKLTNTPRIVGGITKNCTKLTVQFYESFVKTSVISLKSPEIAEMAKILENTFRLVNISMINEFALICGKMNIDIWEVIESAKTKPYGFKAFYPSPKVGGHCIPLDPFYLSWKAREYNFWARFIEHAGQINEQMPHFVVTKIITILNRRKKALSESKILIWGVAYKKDIKDTRESAALDIIPDLLRKGVVIDYFDPYVKNLKIDHKYLKFPVILRSIDYSSQKLKDYDLVLILTDHSNFHYDELAKNANLVLDTRNAIKSRKYKNIYWL